ncbi:hypothetical protein [Actinokineospora globicatena]|uniref:Uncharacterized protein n=1 Tax=Actinokineospora globicatena TaxID=103729 RepID=A0A9W6QU02_9PSEU|nr:hypothetical protein [Actinokineospora globicatena]GLW94750.1 hypothetical protein Aglo03_55660 [Actinokineospora globicatena]
MDEIVITAVLAVGTAGLQMVMKGLSRTNLPGKSHGLSRDDALFWTDWTVTAILALAGSVVVATSQNKAIPTTQVVWMVVVIVLSCSAFPFFLRVFAYGPDAKLKAWGPRGAGWILVCNFVGILVLLGAVFTGVNVYEFR